MAIQTYYGKPGEGMTFTEQQLPLPLIEVEEVLPDFYVADLWSDALRRRARRLARIRARRGVAVPVTPPLSPMDRNSTQKTVIS